MPISSRILREDYERLIARYEVLLAKSRELVKASRGMYRQSQTIRDASIHARSRGWRPPIHKRPANG